MLTLNKTLYMYACRCIYVYLCAYLYVYNDTPLQYSCLENPMDGGAWWAAVLLLRPDLHIGFSRGRSGGLVFPSLMSPQYMYNLNSCVVYMTALTVKCYQLCSSWF